MQDFAGNELKEGQIVVCKPTSRHTRMRFGVVSALSEKQISITYGEFKGYRKVGRYAPDSVYLVQAQPKRGYVHDELVLELPEGFPEALVPVVAEFN